MTSSTRVKPFASNSHAREKEEKGLFPLSEEVGPCRGAGRREGLSIRRYTIPAYFDVGACRWSERLESYVRFVRPISIPACYFKANYKRFASFLAHFEK